MTPQNWLFLVSYEALRVHYLKEQQWNFLAWIGEKGFESSAAAGAFTVLLVISHCRPKDSSKFAGIDASARRVPHEKARILRFTSPKLVSQLGQLENPGTRISFEPLDKGTLLKKYALSYQGIKTGDDPRFRRQFWEVRAEQSKWCFYQSTVTETQYYGGLEYVLDWAQEGKDLARLQGLGAWNKAGVAVSLMRELRCALYLGGPFDSNMSAVVASDPGHFAAIWEFCRSGALNDAVRATFKKTNASDASLIEVPFDLEYWQEKAEASSIPPPLSNEPTQWIFEGHPVNSTAPLQVAVARLLGYQWPQQEDDELTPLADKDGIVCLPAVAGEPPAHERLRQLLAAAYTHLWTVPLQQKLLGDVGYGGKTLADWLRDGFFRQHCQLFKNRPFIWHVWDGRKDGFSALVNYHKLDAARLDKLIYTYLGAWINDRRAEVENGVAGAEGRLVAALALKEKLELIREGEPPYDIYVRWKPLHQQPIGWNPDLNDGVRLNIRPFVTAGVLRGRFTIHWKKDRGKNPDGSERLNDLHFTRAEKEVARQA